MVLQQPQLSSDFDTLLEYGRKDLSFQGRHKILMMRKAAESLISQGNPEDGYYALGLVNGYLNNRQAAVDCFRKVYQLDASEDNCVNYMTSLFDKGDIQAAFDLSKDFLRKNPNNLKIFLFALKASLLNLLPQEFEEIQSLFKGDRVQKLLDETEVCRESLKSKKNLLEKHQINEQFYRLAVIIANQVIREFLISPIHWSFFETPDSQSIVLEYSVNYIDEDECYEMSEIFDDRLKQHLIDNYSDDYDFMSNIFNLCVTFIPDINNKKNYQVN